MTKELVKYTLSNDRLFKIALDEDIYMLDFLKKFNIINGDYKEFIIENTEEVGSLNFKTSNFDVKVKLVNEEDVISYINVEMQNAKTEYDILDRLVLYLSKLIVRSQPKGNTYYKNNCIVVGILNYTLFDDKKFIRKLTINDKENTEIENYQIVLLELTKAEFCVKKELRDWLEIFNAKDLENFKKEPGIMKNLAEKIEKLNKDRIFQSFMDRAELEEQDRLSQANLREERIHKEALEKGLAEGITRGLAEGITRGLAEGRAEGRAEGILEGKNQTLIDVAKKMKELGSPIELIMDVTHLDKETITNL